MTWEADFHHTRAIDHPFTQIQAINTTGTWTWVMADIDRYMGYSCVTTDSGVAVTVLSTAVSFAPTGAPLSVTFTVRVASVPGGPTRGFSPLNFYAVRIPPL
jgi:hypothetical protein